MYACVGKPYQIHADSLVWNEHRQGQIHLQMDAERNAVDDVRLKSTRSAHVAPGDKTKACTHLHPMENLSCNLERRNDRVQPFVQKYDI